MNSLAEKANEIAKAYGPALTKAMIDDEMGPFEDFFISHEPVSVVLQGGSGEEIHATVGNQEDADMTWGEFHDSCKTDLMSQDYVKTDSECVGLLGDRMIMHTGRINKADEIYTEAYFLLTLTAEGKISMIEAFNDVGTSFADPNC
mmetsp:Transcript_11181/g.13498  ORF Transcript_11181/g.13498 Transcript_11181/m.13498 type:complete len:146 (-) Transcript_11181:40-477(-)